MVIAMAELGPRKDECTSPPDVPATSSTASPGAVGSPASTSNEGGGWRAPGFEAWRQLLAGGQVLSALLLSTSYSEKYKGRNMSVGETAELRLPTEAGASDAAYRAWNATLLHRADTVGKQAVAFTWLGDEAQGDKTIYVAFAPLRKKRQFLRILQSTLVEEYLPQSCSSSSSSSPVAGRVAGDAAGDSSASGAAAREELLKISYYINRKLYQLKAFGMNDHLRQTIREYPRHRLIFSGISHGATLAQAAALQCKLTNPDANVHAVTWNAYKWTDEAGSALVERVLGDKMLPLILSLKKGDVKHDWDSVPGFPAGWAQMPHIMLLDSETGQLVPSHVAAPAGMDQAFLSPEFIRRMMKYHFASAAIKATRTAMSSMLGGSGHAGDPGATMTDSDEDIHSDSSGESEAGDLQRDDAVKSLTSLQRRSVSRPSVRSAGGSYSWMEICRGDVLPAGVLQSGQSDDGPVFVARSKGGEPGALTVIRAAGPRRMWSIRCHMGGVWDAGEILVMNQVHEAEWRRVVPGDTWQGSPVQSGTTPNGRDLYVIRSLQGETGSAIMASGQRDEALRVARMASYFGGGTLEQGELLLFKAVDGELEVKVLRCEALQQPEYRFGDVVGAVIGAKSLKPYVEINFAGRSWCTGYLEAPSGSGSFEEDGAVRFPLPIGSNPSNIGALRLGVKAYDKRLCQRWCGGDALIGEHVLDLSEQNLRSEDVCLELTRARGYSGAMSAHGRLWLRLQVRWSGALSASASGQV
eukprot:TRINITY_DN60637_c0_g1_i1.p1 TRINITY_DN60637_c0_g1~~TRINITY_DN60637_c0_g1_i1.p1  ORF type:complete len:752 (-),score=149.62 TRINITY_DN60637_c0_g1_i1:300-2555(-)